jgi:2-dehydro-3-deoxyphosphogluconate aldolase/(4S)-4-hydroxy-2-oxoglutarate aldolase
MTSEPTTAPLLEAVSAAIERTHVVAILRASAPTHLVDAAATLVGQGIDVLELPLTTPGALEAIASARERLGDSAFVGAGTVLTAAQARDAVAAGAQFLVSPATCLDVVAVAVEHGIVSLPGAFTATEVLACQQAGASHIKLFPASQATPGLLGQLFGPFPGLRFVPTGGVGLTDAPGWLSAGACAVGVGSPLVGDALETGDLDALAARAWAWREAVR